jgi:hypothetical protein
MNTVYKCLLDIPFRYIILLISKIISSKAIGSDKLLILRLIIRNNRLLLVLKNRRWESINWIFIMIIIMFMIKIHKVIIVTSLIIEWQLIDNSFNRHNIRSIDFILLIIDEILIIVGSSCLIFIIIHFYNFWYFLRNLFAIEILSIYRL